VDKKYFAILYQRIFRFLQYDMILNKFIYLCSPRPSTSAGNSEAKFETLSLDKDENDDVCVMIKYECNIS